MLKGRIDLMTHGSGSWCRCSQPTHPVQHASHPGIRLSNDPVSLRRMSPRLSKWKPAAKRVEPQLTGDVQAEVCASLTLREQHKCSQMAECNLSPINTFKQV